MSTVRQGQEYSANYVCETHRLLFFDVVLTDDVVLEPSKEYLIFGKIKAENLLTTELLFVPSKDKLAKLGICAASTLFVSKHGEFPIRVINLNDEKVKIFHGTQLGVVEYVDPHESSVEHFRNVSLDNGKTNNKEHLNPTIQSINNNVNLIESEKKEISHLILEFSDIFCKHKSEVGHCKAVTHEIETGSARPVHEPHRRVPLGLESKVDSMVEDMLTKNIIRPSESPWNAPIVVVKKKSGDVRLCMDFRRLNSVTLRPIFPIPEAQHLFDSLGGSRYFSTIDLSNAYYQCEIKESDKCKTAFSTRRGQFEFNRMPFGLSGAPATFSRLMNVVLRMENWKLCLIYLDDVLIFSETFQEHMRRLRVIFTRIREAGIKLGTEKCHFLKKELKYLGHIISCEGLKTDPDKISAVNNWKTPTNIEEMRAFLGFCNYYRKFIKDYAYLVAPLENLMKCSSQGNLNLKKKAF